MRKVLWISGVVAAAAVFIAGAITAYAVYNLTALITHHQQRILNRVSNAFGRPVTVGQIKAHVGLGLSIEVENLKIAEDPSFSKQPFVAADQVSLEVMFVPLLHGKVKVHRLELIKPNIRILRKTDGRFNLGTISNSPTAAGPTRRKGRRANTLHGMLWAVAEEVSIKALEIEDGTVYYSDATLKGVPLQVTHLDTNMTGFHTGSAFDVEVKYAIFSDRPNVEVSGKMGPMLRQGALDVVHCPLDLKFEVGPLAIDSLRTLVAPGSIVPVELSMPNPASASGTITGSIENMTVEATSDLSGYRVIYTAASNKPETAPLTLSVSGRNALRGTIRPLDTTPGNNLTATLARVGLKFEGAQLPAISDLDATIHLTPKQVVVEPASFTVGAGHANLNASAQSISPLKAAFSLKADSLQLSQIVPSRPPGEYFDKLEVAGTAGGELSKPAVNARIKSTSGMVGRLAYRNLDVNGTYAGNRVSARPLSIDVFDGSLRANVNSVLATRPPFNASLSLNHVNLRNALLWDDVNTNAISGFLTGQVNLSGSGTTWGQIEPTMRGSGRLFLSGGTLTGINIVAIAINKIAAAPLVSQLVSAAFRSSNQGLLSNPNTDLRQASMTFALAGPRVTTHDLVIQSPQYEITSDGWFDFNENINMTGDIKLALGLPVAIPVVVMGKYPGLLVLPNIPTLAERAAIGVVNTPINIIKGGVKGLGTVFGGLKSLLP